MVVTTSQGQAVLADPELMSLAERITRTLEKTAAVVRAYHVALSDGLLSDSERRSLDLELSVLAQEVSIFQLALEKCGVTA